MFLPQIQKTRILLLMASFNLFMVYWAYTSEEIVPLPNKNKMIESAIIMEEAVLELKKYSSNAEDATLMEHIKDWLGLNPFGEWLLGTNKLTNITLHNWENYIWGEDFEFQDFGIDRCLDKLENGEGKCHDYDIQEIINDDPNNDNYFSDNDSMIHYDTLFMQGKFRGKCSVSIDSISQWNGCYDETLIYGKRKAEKKNSKKIAKLSTLNPDFAAIIVSYLISEGLDSNSTAAISFTGSFPGANIAVLSACESLGIKTRVISSIGASRFGATKLEFTWLDMQHRLVESNIITVDEKKYLYDPYDARVGKMDKIYYSNIINRLSIHDSLMIYSTVLNNNIVERMAFYGDSINIFINVGESPSSLGSYEIADEINNIYYGMLDHHKCQELKNNIDMEDLEYTLLYEFLNYKKFQIPILNINNIYNIANEFELPYPHRKSEIDIGDSNIYNKINPWVKYKVFMALLLSILNVVGVGIYSFIEIKKRMYSNEPDPIL